MMTEQQKLTPAHLHQQLDELMLRDKQRFAKRLHGAKKVNPAGGGESCAPGGGPSADNVPGKFAGQPEKTGHP